MWPSVVDGVSRRGALFDGRTGKKLPGDADVLAEHEYYLLVHESWRIERSYGIEAELLCKASGWNVYGVRAVSFCEEAAKFFLKYRCRLAENSAEIVPLWPVHVETPYLLMYDSGYSGPAAFFLRGNGRIDVFPRVPVPYDSKTEGGRVFYVESGRRQQLISAGRAGILRYAYIWKDDVHLAVTTPLPEVCVTDSDGKEIPSGEYSQLPHGKSLAATPMFDGHVLVVKGAEVLGRYALRAGTRTTLQGVEYGCSVEVYQGLDLVRRIEYKRCVGDGGRDEALRRALEGAGGESISVPHSLGGLAVKMKDYPQVRRWLSVCVRSGRMPQRAYKLLAHYFSGGR